MAESEIQRIARELRELIADLPRYEDALGDIADRAIKLNRVIHEHRDREDDPEAWRYCDQIIEFTDTIATRARNLAPYIHDTTQIGQTWSNNRANGRGAGSPTVGAASVGTTPTAEPPNAEPEPQTLQWSSTEDSDRRTMNQPLPPNATIVVDGRFTYTTDEHRRVVRVDGVLDKVDVGHPRSEYSQRTLVGKLPGDHAGHLIARIFQGPGQKLNLTPMEGVGVNLGKFATLEDKWRNAVEADQHVEVQLELEYDDDSGRPSNIVVTHSIDGVAKQVDIPNPPSRNGSSDA